MTALSPGNLYKTGLSNHAICTISTSSANSSRNHRGSVDHQLDQQFAREKILSSSTAYVSLFCGVVRSQGRLHRMADCRRIQSDLDSYDRTDSSVVFEISRGHFFSYIHDIFQSSLRPKHTLVLLLHPYSPFSETQQTAMSTISSQSVFSNASSSSSGFSSSPEQSPSSSTFSGSNIAWLSSAEVEAAMDREKKLVREEMERGVKVATGDESDRRDWKKALGPTT